MKKILIAVPCMDMVAAGFAQSLATLTKIGECSVSFMVGSLIYSSRNNLAKQAVQMEADYIMWFDSDMVFKPDTLVQLMQTLEDKNADIVTGVYFNRTAPYRPVIFEELHLVRDKDGFVTDCPNKQWSKEIPNEPFEVEGMGFGCVLMKTDLLFNMEDAGAWFAPMGNIGEDCAFCLRAKAAGYKLWCDPKVMCGHVGHQMITEAIYKAFNSVSRPV